MNGIEFPHFMSGTLLEMSRGPGATGIAGTSLKVTLCIQQASLESFTWGTGFLEAREGQVLLHKALCITFVIIHWSRQVT